MKLQFLTQFIEVCLLIRPYLFNRVSSWSETLPKDNFWKSNPEFFFFVKCDTTIQINDFLRPSGVENIVIFAIRSAVSEIQLFLTLNGKLALVAAIRAAVSEIQLILTLNGKLAFIGY